MLQNRIPVCSDFAIMMGSYADDHYVIKRYEGEHLTTGYEGAQVTTSYEGAHVIPRYEGADVIDHGSATKKQRKSSFIHIHHAAPLHGTSTSTPRQHVPSYHQAPITNYITDMKPRAEPETPATGAASLDMDSMEIEEFHIDASEIHQKEIHNFHNHQDQISAIPQVRQAIDNTGLLCPSPHLVSTGGDSFSPAAAAVAGGVEASQSQNLDSPGNFKATGPHIAVDCANIGFALGHSLYPEKSCVFLVAGIVQCIDSFVELGCHVQGFMSQGRFSTLPKDGGGDRLREYARQGLLTVTPSGDDDDTYIIDWASQYEDGYMVTNDRFRDHQARVYNESKSEGAAFEAWLQKHRITYVFTNKQFSSIHPVVKALKRAKLLESHNNKQEADGNKEEHTGNNTEAAGGSKEGADESTVVYSYEAHELEEVEMEDVVDEFGDMLPAAYETTVAAILHSDVWKRTKT